MVQVLRDFFILRFSKIELLFNFIPGDTNFLIKITMSLFHIGDGGVDHRWRGEWTERVKEKFKSLFDRVERSKG